MAWAAGWLGSDVTAFEYLFNIESASHVLIEFLMNLMTQSVFPFQIETVFVQRVDSIDFYGSSCKKGTIYWIKLFRFLINSYHVQVYIKCINNFVISTCPDLFFIEAARSACCVIPSVYGGG